MDAEARAAERKKLFAERKGYYQLQDEELKKKTRADTANQIFAELDAVAWQQIEPTKLKQFYKEFSEAKNKKSALEIAKKYSIIGFSAKKYDSTKKKFKVRLNGNQKE